MSCLLIKLSSDFGGQWTGTWSYSTDHPLRLMKGGWVYLWDKPLKDTNEEYCSNSFLHLPVLHRHSVLSAMLFPASLRLFWAGTHPQQIYVTSLMVLTHSSSYNFSSIYKNNQQHPIPVSLAWPLIIFAMTLKQGPPKQKGCSAVLRVSHVWMSCCDCTDSSCFWV